MFLIGSMILESESSHDGLADHAVQLLTGDLTNPNWRRRIMYVPQVYIVVSNDVQKSVHSSVYTSFVPLYYN